MKKPFNFTIALLGLWLGSVNVFAEDAPPVSTEAAPTNVPTVGYDKGFFIESADQKFRMTMGGYIQGYFDRKILEGKANTDTFRVRRARLKWYGYLFTKNIEYELEYDFSANRLLEADIQLVHSEGFKYRIGQYHVPFSLEQAASSSTLQFVDRSILYDFFGVPEQREPGTGFNGTLFDKRLDYDVGIFNGEGVNTLNQNEAFRFAGRLVYNIAGKHGVEFSDTKFSETPQVAFGVGAMYNDTPDPTTIPAGSTVAASDKEVTSFTTDLSAKYRGLGAHGAFLYQHTKPDLTASTNDKGWLVQAGYFVLPKTLEVAARIGMIYPEVGNNKGEYTLGVNYYIYNGHQAKFQFDYGALTEKNGVAAGNNRLDHQLRAQLQIKI